MHRLKLSILSKWPYLFNSDLKSNLFCRVGPLHGGIEYSLVSDVYGQITLLWKCSSQHLKLWKGEKVAIS